MPWQSPRQFRCSSNLAFNFANVIVLPLLFGLGVASGIHLVIRRRKEAPGHNLLRSSTSRAVMFSALTTIASFGSLIVSGHPGMRSMGQLLTIAITSTLLCTLIVLPSLMNSRRLRDPDRLNSGAARLSTFESYDEAARHYDRTRIPYRLRDYPRLPSNPCADA